MRTKNRPETLKQIARIAQHDGHFRNFLMNSRTVQLAELLLEGAVVAKELEWFNKMPHDSKNTPAHQDGYYFMISPQEAITMWIALDDVDRENGCLRYVRGSHRLGLREHQRSQVLGFSQGITGYGPNDVRNEVAVSAQPGDLLVHHCLTIHLADRNWSQDRQRRSLGMIYYSVRAQEDKDRYENYQRQLVKDMMSAGRM